MIQLAFDFAPTTSAPARASESDMSLWWRARRKGWSPLPEHLPPNTWVPAPGWRAHARAYLSGRA